MRTGLTLPILVAGLAAVGCNGRPQAQPKDVGPPRVTVANPLVRDVTSFTELTGVLAPVKTADVRPRVSGYVQKILFEEGAEVAADQPLIQIDPAPFQAIVNQAEAALKSAQAQNQVAAANLARQTRIRGTAAATEEEYETTRAQAGVAAANVQAAQAALETAKLNLQYATVRAPFAGRIDRIYVNEGNVVTGGTGQGTILTRVVTVDPIYAYFTVDEATVLQYLRRMASEGRVASTKANGPIVEIRLRDETGYPHKGTIDFASSELNPATGTLQVRGVFPNPGPPRILRPGLFVRGRIPLTTAQNATLIPDAAVVTDQAQKVVYVVGPGNRVVSRPVTLGPQSEGLRVVEGVRPDDRVIIRGLARVQPEMEVEPEPGEIKPVAEPTGQAMTAPNGNPGAGAEHGADRNGVEEKGTRGRPPNAEGGSPPAGPKGM